MMKKSLSHPLHRFVHPHTACELLCQSILFSIIRSDSIVCFVKWFAQEIHDPGQCSHQSLIEAMEP
jgi:hypothetical protein